MELTAAAVTAAALLIACSDGAQADGDTIEACERWERLRDEPIGPSAAGEIRAIAELATDTAVRERATALAQVLRLDFTGTLDDARTMQLDRACRAAID